MAQTNRPRLSRMAKQDQEIHVFTNPINEYDQNESSSSRLLKSSPVPPPPQSQRQPQIERSYLSGYDYQAPLTAHSLRPNSRWLIVRQKLHHIRFMGFNDNAKEGRLPDIYLGLQMTRELKRAQEAIKNVDKTEDFHQIKEFQLPNEAGDKQKFDISHVKPEDALIYDRLGEEPLALQNLFYYFSKQDVPHGTVFWNFLHEVNQVLNLNRKRTALVKRLRRLALTLAIIFYSIIGLMFFCMIIGVITTITKMDDPEVVWMDRKLDGYSSNIVSIK